MTALYSKLNHFYLAIRSDAFNTLLINYLFVAYVLSLTLSYKLDRIIAGLIILLFLFNENLKSKLKISLQHPAVRAFLLFFFVVVIWSISAHSIELALYHIKSYRYFLYPIVFIAMIRHDFIDKIIFAFLCGLLINVLWSYLMFFNILGSPFQMSEHLPILTKPDHALFVLIGLGYSIYRLFTENDNTVIKFLLALFIMLESFNIFITGSRSGMIMYSVMLITVFTFIFKNSLFKVFLFSIVLSSIVYTSAYLFFPPLKKHINTIQHEVIQSFQENQYNSSTGSRLGLIAYSLPVIKEHFFFGVGTSDHIREVHETITEAINLNPEIAQKNRLKEVFRVLESGKLAFLHNTYLDIQIQFGVIGFLIFMNIFYQIYRYQNYSRQIYALLAILICTLFLIGMFPGANFQQQNQGRMFVFMISILMMTKHTPQNTKSNISYNSVSNSNKEANT
ncbi:MAG: O-antigen ligase family protein [Candidatus Cloacimonetes bacterium]|nr:O-antigen ligase family protein [Candidatus Cloacimonadota bacterium]